MDINRVYCIDINNNSTFTNGESAKIVDSLYPINMPYYPTNGRFKVYTEDFLTDIKNGDFDTKGYFYMITPNGEKVELNIFKAETENGWVDITKEEYEERKARKIK